MGISRRNRESYNYDSLSKFCLPHTAEYRVPHRQIWFQHEGD
jgi:hypothetical protein